jgi:photoactive yellow protein
MTKTLKMIPCAWCGRGIEKWAGLAGSFGLCRQCLGEGFHLAIGNIAAVDSRLSDVLPFGFIRLDADGIILQYNTSESALSGLPQEKVKGRNFFRSVAPCTCVEEFEGLTKKMIAARQPARERIQFLFKFPSRVTMVNIAIIYDPERKVITLLIRKVQ